MRLSGADAGSERVHARGFEGTLAGMVRARYTVAMLWLALVLFMGASYFGAQKTADLIIPVLKFLAPHASVTRLNAVHMLVRKLSHLAEYAILAALWFKALSLGARRTPRTAVWVALSVCLLCAFADEAHQSTLPARSGSARDFVIDASGALGALIFVRSRWTTRDPETPVEPVVVEPAD